MSQTNLFKSSNMAIKDHKILSIVQYLYSHFKTKVFKLFATSKTHFFANIYDSVRFLFKFHEKY
jgi:hypothetical protein